MLFQLGISKQVDFILNVDHFFFFFERRIKFIRAGWGWGIPESTASRLPDNGGEELRMAVFGLL